MVDQVQPTTSQPGPGVQDAASRIGLFNKSNGAEPEANREEPAEHKPQLEGGEVEDDEAILEDEGQADGEKDAKREDEQETSEEAVYEVKVDGKTQKVSLEELRSGYAREADYRRKTQALASERKAHEQSVQGVAAELNRRLEATEHIYKQALDSVNGQLGQEPEWDKLRAENPDKYIEEHLAWNDKLRKRDQLTQTIQQVQQVRQQQAQQYMKYMQAQCFENLKADLPAFTDPEKGGQYRQGLETYAISQGFKAEELAYWSDPRLFVLLDKAMRLDRASKGKPVPESKRKGAKPARAGAGVSASDRRADSVREQRERLRRNPSDRRAMAAAVGAAIGNR